MKGLAIVTGASSGIGNETALRLGKLGYDLVLAARREAPMRQLAEELPDVSATVVGTDLSEPDQCFRLVRISEGVCNSHYPILINAAGIACFGPYADLEEQEVRDQLNVNLLGPAMLCRGVLPWMLRCGGGQIINILSITATQTVAGSAAYSASKAGLHMLGKVISADYRKQGIRVTAVLPGAVDTPIWDGQAFIPKREDMLSTDTVAQAIVELVEAPRDRNVDELVLMPPKGFL